MNAHHFPMPGSGVLAGRGERAPSISRGRIARRDARKRLDIPKPEPREVRNLEPADARDIADGIAVRIEFSILSGIGHGANTGAVENDPDDSAEHSFEGNMGNRRGDAKTRRSAQRTFSFLLCGDAGLLSAPQHRGDYARVAPSMENSDHPQWFFLRRVSDHIFSHQLESQWARSQF